MTILSKDAAASSGPGAQNADSQSKSALFDETGEGLAGSPPSYADSQAAGPSTTHAEQLRPTNFMNIDKAYGPIKGTWVIDTNIQIPEALLPSLGFFASLRTRPNLALHSASGNIKASVFLVSSSSSRAILKADTDFGNVTLPISRVGSKQPFKLSGHTKYGDLTVGLPRDYVGPLKYKTGWGKTTFSAELKSSVVEISGENSFVGDLSQSGFIDWKAWSKDEVEVETSYGDVHFMYVDEVPASFGDTVGRAVKTALGWLGIQ